MLRECPTPCGRTRGGGRDGHGSGGDDAAISWHCTPPQANDEKAKTVSGIIWLWYGSTCGYWNTGAVDHLTEDHKVKGPSSGPKATLLVQDQTNAAVAQALFQVNLGTPRGSR
jgi:hypothetical protein